MENETKTVVIKYGGSVRDEPTDLLREIAQYAQAKARIVVVHGGGSEISQFLARLGHESRFIGGQRVTDEITLDTVEMVLSGRVGKRIVRTLQGFGAPAVGISGEDGGIIRAVPFSSDEALGLVGRVDSVNALLLETLLQAGYVPVVAPLGVDGQGQVRNINADFAAGSIAGSLRSTAFLLATDVPGVKASPEAANAIPRLSVREALQMIEDGVATGGMIPKIQAAARAVQAGASEARIVDGRGSGILAAVLGGKVLGTQIVADTEGATQDA